MSYPFQPNPPTDAAVPAAIRTAPPATIPAAPTTISPPRRSDWIVVDLIDRLSQTIYSATEPWPDHLQDELGRPLRQAVASVGVVVSGCFRTHFPDRRERFEEIARRLLRRIGRTVATAQREGLLTPDVALHIFGMQSAIGLALGQPPSLPSEVPALPPSTSAARRFPGQPKNPRQVA